MIALRATVRSPEDRYLTAILWDRFLRFRCVPVGADQILALIPGAGSAVVTRRPEWIEIDLVVDRPARLQAVISGLESQLRSGELAERIAISWTRPDTIPVRLR